MLKESTKPDDIKRLELIKGNLGLRSRLLSEIRDYFRSEGVLEIETPVMVKSPAPEDFINAPQAGKLFLRASPELHMKRMVAAGYGDIYQIGPCFREGENGRLHNQEFTMLEWYHSGKDYNYLLIFLENMLSTIVEKITGGTAIEYKGNQIDFSSGFHVMTVNDCFVNFSGMTAEKAIENDCFEIVLTEKIEPALPVDKPVILKDYPARMAALSRMKNDGSGCAERWELYIAGIEIANAYSELTNVGEQIARFDSAHLNRKNKGLPEYPQDEDFFKAMKYGMPEFTGCALGIDRLAMIFANCDTIDQIRAFKI